MCDYHEGNLDYICEVSQVFQRHQFHSRASSILDILKREEFEALKGTRNYPEINAGDSIQVDKLLYVSSKETVSVKGVVIGVTKKYSDTSISMINVES